MDILLILLVSLIIPIFIYKLNKITTEGVALLFVFSSSLYLTGGLLFFSLFMIFIALYIVLIAYKKDENDLIIAIQNKRENKIDVTQIISNGIPALIMALLYMLSKNEMFIVAFCIVIAGSTANMMGARLGITSKKEPVSITTFKPIRRGLSGGVTWFGIFSSFLGALVISLSFILFNIDIISSVLLINASFILIGGFMCSILNSVLGDLLQAKYIDYETGLITEIPNSNDIDKKKAKGIRLIGNNFIDFISLILVSLIYIIIKIYS
jgi:uncharacterized protein (TIGR00297 family)